MTTRVANRVQVLTTETTILVSTSFLSKSQRRAGRKRPLSSGVPEADLMLFWLLARGFTRRRQNRSERVFGAGIPRPSGRKIDQTVRSTVVAARFLVFNYL